MKRKMILGVFALLLLTGGMLSYVTFFSYEPSKELSDFPIPKKAELVEATENVRMYNWAPASEENGIPFGYEVVLKNDGWEAQEREGASVIYTKGNKQIDLISQAQLLTLRDMEKDSK